MAYSRRFRELDPGDLVTWLGHDSKTEMKGIILDIWESNVYEPEECEIFVDESQTIVVRSRYLKVISKGHL